MRLPATIPAPLLGADHEHVIRLPEIRQLTRHAAQHIAEGALIPAITFYAVLSYESLRWALVASLCWAYLVIGVRLVRRRRMPGIVLLSAGLLSVRTAVSYAANSSFLYLLQPSLGNLCLAALFALSLFGRPLTRRLADDFCALPASLDAHPRFQRFFVNLALLWAVICGINGLGSIALLLHSSLGSFLALRPVISYGLVAAGTLTSYLWFRRTMHGEGVRIVFGARAA